MADAGSNDSFNRAYILITLTWVVRVVDAHLTSCLWTIHVDLLLSLAIECFDCHYSIVCLPLVSALGLLILVFK